MHASVVSQQAGILHQRVGLATWRRRRQTQPDHLVARARGDLDELRGGRASAVRCASE